MRSKTLPTICAGKGNTRIGRGGGSRRKRNNTTRNKKHKKTLVVYSKRHRCMFVNTKWEQFGSLETRGWGSKWRGREKRRRTFRVMGKWSIEIHKVFNTECEKRSAWVAKRLRSLYPPCEWKLCGSRQTAAMELGSVVLNLLIFSRLGLCSHERIDN